MKYYLAGPMTGIPEFNFPLFIQVCEYLRERELTILSPHEIDHGETDENRGSLSYGAYMRAGLRLMLDCDGVIVLPGWKESQGVRVELALAKACEMELHRFDTETGYMYTLERWEIEDAN
jgi:hypothetical protein